VRYALMTEPQQGLSYEEILAIARAAEVAGFEAFFRSDHYTSFPGPAGRPTTDCWATLAGLARETDSIRLGSLVSPVTFRMPGAYAKLAMTVNEMSGGRVEVGVGAGWNTLEHEQHGLPLPPLKERVDMMEEELIILHGLFDEPDGWSFEGRHWQVRGSLFRPRDKRPPIIIGGGDKRRGLRLAARYADEYNVSSSGPAAVRGIFARLDEECRAIGRDPATITHSVMAGVLIGRDQAEVDQRVQDQLDMFGEKGGTAEAWLEERRSRWLVGTLDQARSTLHEFEAAGVERIMCQDLLPRDLEQVQLIGELLATT
jgi:F420-dependent oxidoreductase-like protein